MPTLIPFSSSKFIATIAGPAAFLVIIMLPPFQGLSDEGQSVLAITAWVAIWWITEALPIPVTSLLPIVVMPVTGAASLAGTTAAYGNSMIYLYMGGFILALAIERWNLHKRLALYTVYFIGGSAERIIFGFMLASFFLSMWISNTATTVMMLPIALAVSRQLPNTTDLQGNKPRQLHAFGLPLMLGIAYASSIGGITTLIGTPTNAMFSAVVGDLYGQSIDFSRWMMFAFPVSVVLLFACWFLLVKVLFPVSKANFGESGTKIGNELAALGPMTTEEKRVSVIFGCTAFAWISSSFLLKRIIPGIDDAIIAIAAVFFLFLIPSSKKGERLMNWETAIKLPWGILILFGGGLALANGFQSTGLAAWIGNLVTSVEPITVIALLILIGFVVNFLTEITSNVATATILLPIVASIAGALGLHPYPIMALTTIAASCAFMLPVATPPNAVVFSSGYISIRQMVRAGFSLNIISVFVVVLAVRYLLPLLWNIDLFAIPPFAK